MGHAARQLATSDTVLIYPRRFQQPRGRREEAEMVAQAEEDTDIAHDGLVAAPADALDDAPSDVSATPAGRGRGGVWLVLGGLFLVAAVLGVGWMLYGALRGDAAPRASSAARPSLMTTASRDGPPPARAEETSADPALLPTDALPAPPEAESVARAIEGTPSTTPAVPEPRSVEQATDATEELRQGMATRFDQVDAGLQNVRGLIELVVAELRTNPLSGEMQEKLDAADKMVTLLKTQGASKDGEIVRLRRELAERERLIADMKEENRRLAEKPALPGWEIVGLTARNAAFKDPAGHTRVIAVGEVIVDGVKLLEIDTAANRVGTTSGYMVYRSLARQ